MHDQLVGTNRMRQIAVKVEVKHHFAGIQVNHSVFVEVQAMGGAEHEWAAVEVGAWAAKALGVPLMLLGSKGDGSGEKDASRLLAHASLATQKGLGVDASPMLIPPGDQGVLDAITRGSLLVIGLSERWEKAGLGATRHTVARDANVPVLIVRRGLRPGGLAPRQSLTRFTWALSGRFG